MSGQLQTSSTNIKVTSYSKQYRTESLSFAVVDDIFTLTTHKLHLFKKKEITDAVSDDLLLATPFSAQIG